MNEVAGTGAAPGRRARHRKPHRPCQPRADLRPCDAPLRCPPAHGRYPRLRRHPEPDSPPRPAARTRRLTPVATADQSGPGSTAPSPAPRCTPGASARRTRGLNPLRPCTGGSSPPLLRAARLTSVRTVWRWRDRGAGLRPCGAGRSRACRAGCATPPRAGPRRPGRSRTDRSGDSRWPWPRDRRQR